MAVPGIIELITAAAATAALAAVVLTGGKTLRGDSRLALYAVIVLALLRSLGGALLHSGLLSHPASAWLGSLQGYISALMPFSWGFFAYVYFKNLERRELAQAGRGSLFLAGNLPQRIYFKDRDLRYVSANEAFAESIGRPLEELAGKTDFDLYPAELAEVYRQEDSRVLTKGQPETRFEREDGDPATRLVEVSRMPIRDEEGDVAGLLGVITDIDRGHDGGQTLRPFERQQTAILDSMSELVVYLDLLHNILWANRAAADACGLRRDELQGRKCYRVWWDRDDPCPDCHADVAAETGQPQDSEVTGDDERAWAVTYYPVVGPGEKAVATVEVAEEITQRKQAAQTAAHLAAVVQASDDAIIGLSPDGKIRSWNAGAESIFGYNPQKARGRCIAEVVPEEHEESLREVLQRAAGGESIQHFEVPALPSRGHPLNVSLTFSPIFDDHGRVTGISAIGRDITEQVQLREELRKLSLVDNLTDLHNRRGFFHLGNQQLKVAARTGSPVMLLFADVDGMKRINDELGHQAGDQALIETARVLERTFRGSDIIARIGGDEFAVLAVDAPAGSEGEVQDRLRQSLTEQNAAAERPFTLSLSEGWALYDPDNPRTIDELLAEADARMYEHKRARTEYSSVADREVGLRRPQAGEGR